MKNGIRSGQTMTWTNATGSLVTSGSVVVVGTLVGVAIADIKNGEVGELKLTGVHSLPKAAESITQGNVVYWDGSAVTETSTDNDELGTAFLTYVSGDSHAEVLLKQGPAAFN